MALYRFLLYNVASSKAESCKSNESSIQLEGRPGFSESLDIELFRKVLEAPSPGRLLQS